MSTPLRVVSLGGGVQSTVMALMAGEGRFGESPDLAIFADTGWEPEGVYDNVKWLSEVLPYRVHTVAAPHTLLRDMENGVRVNGAPGISLPVFLREGGGPVGMARRRAGWRSWRCFREVTDHSHR